MYWSRHNTSVTAKRSFTKEGNLWQLKLEAKIPIIAKLKQRVTFEINEGCQIQPKTMDYKRRILGKKRRHRITFDKSSNEITETYKKKSLSFPYDQIYYDKMSYQVALRCDLKRNKKIFNYKVFSHGKSRDYDFKIIQEETLKTAIGKVNAVKLSRIHNNSKKETSIWLAKDLDYFLLKITKTDEDETYLLEIKSINWL